MGKPVIAAISVLLPACSAQPQVAREGPSVAASLDATWDMGEAPGRQAGFSRDGSLLAASNAAGEIVVRRSSDWKIVQRLRHAGGVTSLAFGPDPGQLFTAGYDGRIRIWDVSAGTAKGEIAASALPIWTLDIAPDGKRLAVAGEDKIVRLWPIGGAPAKAAELRGHARNVWEVRFSPDGRQIASASFDETARTWTTAGKPQKLLRGHSEAVVALDYHPNGRTIATGGDDSTIRFWDSASGAHLRTVPATNHVYKLSFSSDGAWLASSGRARGSLGTFWYQLFGTGAASTPVSIWRVSDGALVGALTHPTDVFSVAFSPDGRFLVTNDNDGDVRLWRLNYRR